MVVTVTVRISDLKIRAIVCADDRTENSNFQLLRQRDPSGV